MRKMSHDPVWGAFLRELTKLSSISDEEAVDAAKALSESSGSRVRRYASSAAVGAVASPLIGAAGELAAAVAGPRGTRMRAAKNALRKSLSRPELAKRVATGVLSGGALQAVRENVQLSKARKTYEDFLHEHSRGA